jgi:hypothetical protein
MQPYGITQVFTCPHPYKITDKGSFHSEKPPRMPKATNESRRSLTKLADSANEQPQVKMDIFNLVLIIFKSIIKSSK